MGKQTVRVQKIRRKSRVLHKLKPRPLYHTFRDSRGTRRLETRKMLATGK